MSKRIVIAAGGTGGHLFPAQSLAEELKEQMPDCVIRFMGKGLSTNPRFDKKLYEYDDIASSPLSKGVKAVFHILKGVWQARRALKRFHPDVVIGFGSYHTFPILVACRLLGIELLLHEANSIPGKVNRLFSSYAAMTGVFFPDTAKLLKGNVQETDIPLRDAFSEKRRPSKNEALQFYGLQENAHTVLVFGGSLGAKKLNEMACKSLCRIEKPLQVLHFTGSFEASQLVRAEYSKAKVPAVVRDFESEMQYAWAAADLCISRAGASTVAEAIAFGVPVVFIPYPFASDHHQDKNAEYLVKQIEAAVSFQEKGLDPEELAGAVEKLIAPVKQEAMKEKLKSLRSRMQTRRFSDIVVQHLRQEMQK